MATSILPLINGKSYEHADITCIVLGVHIIGITAIEYGEDSATTNIWTTGRFPTSRIHGKVEPMAKITMLMEEVMNILTVAPNGRIYEIPEFDIIVTFTDASLIPVVHKLKNGRFKNNKISSSTGDDAIPVEMDLVISNVDWGV